MADLQKNLMQTIEKHGLIQPGERVYVALSGGMDSMALLHALNCAKDVLSIQLEALHYNHAIRPESREEAEFVAGVCQTMGIPLTMETWDRGGQGNPSEARAREARYGFFAKAAQARPGLVATAHHQKDQAETILLHLLRGSALRGLGGMPIRRGIYIRPLLETAKERIEDYIIKEGICYRQDASNDSGDYLRNRVRHELLPLLKRDFSPRIEESLIRNGRVLAQDEAWLSSRAEEAFGQAKQLLIDGQQIGRAHV